MAHTLTIEELKQEWKKLDAEGKKHLADVQRESEYTLNSIATSKMNACITAKNNIQTRIGKMICEDEQS